MTLFHNLIAITGGIGSGKTIVSRILREMGYPVYDCDSRAKELMDSDPRIKKFLVEKIDPLSITNDKINRQLVAKVVFENPEKLAALNHVVHEEVRKDLTLWAMNLSEEKLIFVETAILYESELDRMVNRVWEVTAPDDLRVKRVVARSGISVQEAKARIKAQNNFIPERLHENVSLITNDDISAVLPQIASLLAAQ